MSSGPLVSVIIPTYNRRAMLAEALQSVFDQTHTNLEVIVIDDGSNDGTGDYVRGFQEGRIVYISIEHQGSPGAARNAGLKRAKGEFIAFLDSDDKWVPEKTETQLQVLRDNPELDFVASDFYRLPSGRHETGLRLSRQELLTFEGMLRACPVHNSSVLIRKEAVDAVGMQDETLLTCQDREYWLRVLRRRDRSGVILPLPLSVYRQHEGNRSIQDVVQCERLSTIVGRHRDYDEALINSVLGELRDQAAFRQAALDLASSQTSLASVLLRREVRMFDRLRLIRQRIRGRRGRAGVI